MKRVLSAVIAAALVFQMAVAGAEGYISFSGQAPAGYSGKWLTCMTVKNGADTETPAAEDIGWIGQERISKNGSYSIKIPASQFGGEFELLSSIAFVNKIYVSELQGSDTANGGEQTPVKTLNAALARAGEGDTIVLTDMVSVPKNMVWRTDKKVTLTGKNPVTGQITGGLNLTGTVSLRILSEAVFENMTLETLKTNSISENANKLFACGNRIVMGEGLTMTNPIDIFGGNTINNSANGTELTIMSGLYRRIFGGGENSPTYGDTHVTIKNMNVGMSANDSSKAYYDSRIYGGGKNPGSDVDGSSYINFLGGTAAYISGCSSASSLSGDTHIFVSGGRVMNIYGGSVDEKTVHSGNTYIEMTGGTAESIFGGSSRIGFKGNTFIRVCGGEILRRIYGGCYNDYDGGWGSDHFVTGSCAVVIGPEARLITKGDLSVFNTMNSGIFGGSRAAANHGEETGILIFENDAYKAHGDKIGEQSGYFANALLSHHDYLVRAGAGGRVVPENKSDIRIIPDAGKAAVANGVKQYGGLYTLSGMETEIVFEDGYTITGALSEKSGDKAVINAEVVAGNPAGLNGMQVIIAAVYDSAGRFAGAAVSEITENGSKDLNIKLPETGESFNVRLFIWDKNELKPLGTGCSFILGEGI
ncbi:MAG: hypothetical protein J6N52_07415 [Clostridia bacterium]|nr:hypothetical protein [Clostridia bacterium]